MNCCLVRVAIALIFLTSSLCTATVRELLPRIGAGDGIVRDEKQADRKWSRHRKFHIKKKRRRQLSKRRKESRMPALENSAGAPRQKEPGTDKHEAPKPTPPRRRIFDPEKHPPEKPRPLL